MVVCENIDLIFWLLYLSVQTYIWSNRVKEKFHNKYSSDSILDKTAAGHILCLPTFSGYDTTCNFINSVRRIPNLSKFIEAFTNPNDVP